MSKAFQLFHGFLTISLGVLLAVELGGKSIPNEAPWFEHKTQKTSHPILVPAPANYVSPANKPTPPVEEEVEAEPDWVVTEEEMTRREDGEIHVGMAIDFKGVLRDYRVSIHPKETHSNGSIVVEFLKEEGHPYERHVLLRDGVLFEPMEVVGEHAGLLLFTKNCGSSGAGELQYLEYTQEAICIARTLPKPDSTQLETEESHAIAHDWAWMEDNRLFRRWPLYREGDCMASPTGGELTFEYVWDEEAWVLAD